MFERFWNILMRGLSYHSKVLLGNLQPAVVAKVLGVGCGRGDTAIQLARMVGPSGWVMGPDCCASFLDKGRCDAEVARLTNTRFV